MGTNRLSLDTVCAALCYAMGVEAPKMSADKNAVLSEYIDIKLKGEKADRIFMYNPDGIAQWLYEKYHIETENEHFARENGVVYRKGKVFRNCIDKHTGNSISRVCIRENHARVMYDTSHLEILED